MREKYIIIDIVLDLKNERIVEIKDDDLSDKEKKVIRSIIKPEKLYDKKENSN